MIYEIRHLRRSGSHGVINWLMGHFDNIDAFMNIDNCGVGVGHSCATEIHGNKHTNMLYSYENVSPYDLRTYVNIKNEEVNHNFKNNYGDSFPKKILIIRNPLNWAASHIHARIKEGSTNYNEINFTQYKEYLKAMDDDDFYIIIYDHWFQYPEYRRKIENDLNLIESDGWFERVSNYGGGSSFDGVNFDGNAQKMDVLERWIKYKDHPIIQRIEDTLLESFNEKSNFIWDKKNNK